MMHLLPDSHGVEDRSREIGAQVHYAMIERLRASEENYRTLVESLKDVVFQCDPEGRIVFLNSAWTAILGYEIKECLGALLSDYVTEHDRDRLHKTLLSNPMVEPLREVSFVRRDGAVLEMELSVRVHCEGAVGSLHDVTYRKDVERALVHAKEAAEQATVMKSRFLANMSHEIRTPMSAVLGLTSVLIDTPVDAPGRTSTIERIRANGEHLLRLIDDILDYSQIEAGRLDLITETVSPADVLLSVHQNLLESAEQKGLDLTIELSAEVPELVEIESTRLRQIVTNLVSNAVKFTDEGLVAIRVDYSQDAQELVVEVEDSGVGMTPEESLRVFEPFQQADTSHSRKHGGAGLGLSITRSLVDVMGGKISVESWPGKGTSFVVLLPARAGGIEETHTAPIPVLRTHDRLEGRVLLAEDNPDLSRLVAHYMKKWGIECDVVANGLEAISKINENAGYDLVLLDMQMPVKDGYQAASEIRGRGFRGRVVALTAHAMRGDREKCIEAGCDDYLAKPVSADLLRAVLARHLRGGVA